VIVEDLYIIVVLKTVENVRCIVQMTKTTLNNISNIIHEGKNYIELTDYKCRIKFEVIKND
jgi:hypothetical protein